jgi:hypothetical protein
VREFQFFLYGALAWSTLYGCIATWLLVRAVMKLIELSDHARKPAPKPTEPPVVSKDHPRGSGWKHEPGFNDTLGRH